MVHKLQHPNYEFNLVQWNFVMANTTHYTLKTRLKTVPASEDLKKADPNQVRIAKQKADFVWQMNLAKLKLNALKDKNKAASDALIGFHDAARKSLWHARRAG